MDWQQVLDLRRNIFDVCGEDEQMKDTFEIFCNMYNWSDWAESKLKIEIKNKNVANGDDAGFGRLAHTVIESLRPKVTLTTSIRKEISSELLAKLFLSATSDADVETWANLACNMGTMGRSPTLQFSLYFANYMRAGLTAFTEVMDQCKLETDNKEYLKSFANDCLSGGKVYPTMVWGEEEPFIAIIRANQFTKDHAGSGTKIKEWKLPSARTIQEILHAFIYEMKGETDWFGRQLGDVNEEYCSLKGYKDRVQQLTAFKHEHPEIEKIASNDNRIKGDALLGQYQELTITHPVVQLRQYHFQCFWHWMFLEIHNRKEWAKLDEGTGELANKQEVVNRLFDNRRLIVECMGNSVPATEADKLTKPFIEQALGAPPPLADQYTRHPKLVTTGSAMSIAALLYGQKCMDPTHAQVLSDLRAGTFKTGTYESFDPNKLIKVTGSFRGEGGVPKYTYSELKKAA